MKKFFGFLWLTALVSVWGCASSDAPPVEPLTTEAVETEDAPLGEDSAAATAKPPKGHFVQANPSLATLRAKFVYGGKAPALKAVDTSRDPFCAQLEILSESMLVGQDGGLKNLVLIMDPKKSADIPAEQMQVPEKTVQLDNDGCIFKPHIIFVRPGQKIEVLNSDQTGHNANFSFFRNEAVNFLIPVGGKKEFEIKTEESASLIPVECNIHPWMKAYVVVQEHPYVGMSDEAGQIEIVNLPVGEVTFYVRHENAAGSIDEGTVNGKSQKWSRGRMELKLNAGLNDLGTITIAADKFRS